MAFELWKILSRSNLSSFNVFNNVFFQCFYISTFALKAHGTGSTSGTRNLLLPQCALAFFIHEKMKFEQSGVFGNKIA